MVVDYLRSCYTTQARFFHGSPGRLSTIRWYFAAPDAQQLPIGTVFTSNNWLDASERPGTDVGEVHGEARVWNNGHIDHRPPGTHYHGDPYFFEVGSDPGNLLRRLPSGIPVACVESVAPAGGLVLGGEAWTGPYGPPFTPDPCPASPIAANLAVTRWTSDTTAVTGPMDPRTVPHDLGGQPTWKFRFGPQRNDFWGYDFPGGEVIVTYDSIAFAAIFNFDAATGTQLQPDNGAVTAYGWTCSPFSVQLVIPFGSLGILHTTALYAQVSL